jgi:RNA polymerase subunit RPABC4/transcription elongation factor Spt4
MNACRMCGHEIAPSAKACPNCGASDPNIGDFRGKTIVGAAFAFAIAAALFIAAAGNSGGWKTALTLASLVFVGGGVYGLYHGATGKDG